METDTNTTTGSDCSAASCSASFTPGPWTIGDENNQHIEICIGDAVANLDRQDRYGMHMAFSREEMRANGKLIAAAPKMIAALQFYAEHMKLGYGITDSGQVAEEAIREALGQNV